MDTSGLQLSRRDPRSDELPDKRVTHRFVIDVVDDGREGPVIGVEPLSNEIWDLMTTVPITFP